MATVREDSDYGYQDKTNQPQVQVQSPEKNIDPLFAFHTSNPYTGPKMETVRDAAKYFAEVLMRNVPAGADRSAAIRKVREAMMTANAGISLGGYSL